jgi:hypothetical protein
MELVIEIKKWPLPEEPLLADIENLYTGPHEGDVLEDEAGIKWIARDEVSRFEAEATNFIAGIFGDYQYNTRLRVHQMILKGNYHISWYMKRLIDPHYFREREDDDS